jgi:hypothetical protein
VTTFVVGYIVVWVFEAQITATRNTLDMWICSALFAAVLSLIRVVVAFLRRLFEISAVVGKVAVHPNPKRSSLLPLLVGYGVRNPFEFNRGQVAHISSSRKSNVR